MLKPILSCSTAAIVAVMGLSSSVAADGHETVARTFPAIFGAASAVAAPGGSGYVALTYSTPRGGVSGNDADGDVSAGYTIGNPVKNVSVSFGVNINSLSDNFGDSGNFTLGLSRVANIGERSVTFVGLSAGKLAGWGDAASDDETYSAYVSHVTAYDSGSGEIPVQYTLGYGADSTLSEDGLGTLSDGIFYGVGVGVSETVSVSLSGTETQLNLGGTVIIPSVSGLSVTAGVYDATDNASRQQYSLTVAYGF